MNYTQSFEEFSSSLGPTDLALYAGIGVVLFVLFKDKLSPVQKMLLDLFDQVKEMLKSKPAPAPAPLVRPEVFVPNVVKPEDKSDNDVFFEMVAAWKRTRDLAEQYKCEEAVKSLDDTFQYLAPTVCGDKK